MIKPSVKMAQHGLPVNSNNKLDTGSDYYFDKLIYDTINDIKKDIRRGQKKPKWYFLPTMEHLKKMKEIFNEEIEYKNCGDYVQVRLKK